MVGYHAVQHYQEDAGIDMALNNVELCDKDLLEDGTSPIVMEKHDNT